jgi:cell division protease FtsH
MTEPINDFPAKKKPNRKWWYISGAILLALVIGVGGYFYYKANYEKVEIPLGEAVLLSKQAIFSYGIFGDKQATLTVADNVTSQKSIDIDNNPIELKAKQQVQVNTNYMNANGLKTLGFVLPDNYKAISDDFSWSVFIAPTLMIVLLVFIVLWSQGKLPMSSNSKIFERKKDSVTFKEVGGIDEVKDSLKEAVSFLVDRKYMDKLGAQVPRGILLTGLPGCGKTLLARATAAEAGVKFFYATASDFQSHFFGLSAQRLRQLFIDARRQPSIIFIDEFESIAQKRNFTGTDVSRDNQMSINQILAEMDGFNSKSPLLVIAATNHPEVLDPAILRPGRFDRKITVGLPSFKERMEILSIHCRNKPLAEDIDIESIAKQTGGFSGADLAAILNEAAIFAGREHKEKIEAVDINNAIDKVLTGDGRKAVKFTDAEKRLVAYHEAGHALVASLLPECDRVQRISILPHGESGGFTRLSSEKEERLISKSKAKSAIAMMLGGRVAEELIIGDISNGASNDLMKANQLATEMVERFGMGKKFGLRFCDQFNGKKALSSESRALIDQDVQFLLNEAYGVAKGLIEGKKETLDALANRLIEIETIDAEEVNKIIGEKRCN